MLHLNSHQKTWKKFVSKKRRKKKVTVKGDLCQSGKVDRIIEFDIKNSKNKMKRENIHEFKKNTQLSLSMYMHFQWQSVSCCFASNSIFIKTKNVEFFFENETKEKGVNFFLFILSAKSIQSRSFPNEISMLYKL